MQDVSGYFGARPDHTHHAATAMMSPAIKNIGSRYQGHSIGSGGQSIMRGVGGLQSLRPE